MYDPGKYQYMNSLSVHKKADKIVQSKNKQTDKFYKIMNKTGKTLDEITKKDLTKTEYKFIVEYIIKIMNCPISLYPNL